MSSQFVGLLTIFFVGRTETIERDKIYVRNIYGVETQMKCTSLCLVPGLEWRLQCFRGSTILIRSSREKKIRRVFYFSKKCPASEPFLVQTGHFWFSPCSAWLNNALQCQEIVTHVLLRFFLLLGTAAAKSSWSDCGCQSSMVWAPETGNIHVPRIFRSLNPTHLILFLLWFDPTTNFPAAKTSR